MENQFPVENLEQAIALFYAADAQQQTEAHKYLNDAQNSQEAWGFVWQLLNPQKSFQVQFFGATTLHTKLMKHWAELPQDHYETLKKRILDCIVDYAMGPKIVLNRLCIAMASYIIHTVPTHWPKAFEELLSSFQPQHLPNVEPERVIWILLEILSVVPEEIITVNVILGQRNRARYALLEVSKDILKFVEMCLMPIPSNGFEMINLTTYLHAAKCASSWIQLGGVNIEECTSIVHLLVDLTCFVYWNRGDPECLSGEEIELIDVTVEALSAIIQHPLAGKFRNSVVKHSFAILYKFDKILETERNCSDLNKDVVASLYGLIITIADTHSRMFIDHLKMDNTMEQRLSFDLYSCILKCTDLPGLYPVDESASTLTFGFWYTLQDDILNLETAECAQLLLLIKPYYRNLVCVLLRKSLLPIDDNQWSLDDKEVFRCYRQDIADTFVYCYNVLNLEMLDILTTKLNEALAVENNGNSGTQNLKWNEIETCLHAFCAVAEGIELENLYLPKLMLTIKNIPFNLLHIKVLTTALDTVGAYCDWFVDHPELLDNVIPLIISSLNNPEIATSSTMALKDITSSCQKFLIPYAEHILISARSALLSGALKLSECRRLMLSIGKVLSIMPVVKIMGYLNEILAPMFQDIQKLVDSEVNCSTATFLMSKLKVVAALFNSLYMEPPDEGPQPVVEQPIFVLMQSTMPLYKQIAEKYCNNSEVIVDLTALLKYGVANLKDDCKPLVSDILEIVVRTYSACPQGQILVVAETIITLFDKDSDISPLCRQLIREISNTTMQACSQYNSNNQLEDLCDVLECYFNMMSKIMKRSSQLVKTSDIDLAAIFQCAVLSLILPESQTMKAITSYLVNFITQSREILKSDIVQNFGQSLVLRMLLNIGSNMPRTSLVVLGDIFLALNKKYCDNLSRWLNSLMAQEDFPSPRVSPAQKEAFIKLILREKTNKRKVEGAVVEFTLICKGVLIKEDGSLPRDSIFYD